MVDSSFTGLERSAGGSASSGLAPGNAGMIITRRVRRDLIGVAGIGVLLCAGAGHLEARQQPDPAVLQQHATEGERALAEGRYPDAEKAYETLRRLSPGTAEVQARLGLIYFQEGKFGDAIAPLREALRLKPGLPKVDALLAMSLSELGRYDEALPALTKAFSQPTDAVLRRMSGLHLQRVYTGLGRDLDAADVALRLSRLYPDDPEVLYHSARLLANYAYLQTMRLAAVAPDSVWLHQAAGEANESQGLYDAAIREYRQVLTAAPRRPGMHFRIGRVLLERSNGDASSPDVPEARRAFEEELALDPDERERRLRARGDASQGGRARAGTPTLRAGGVELPRVRAGAHRPRANADRARPAC